MLPAKKVLLILLSFFTLSFVFLTRPQPASAALIDWIRPVETITSIITCDDDGTSFIECMVRDAFSTFIDVAQDMLAPIVPGIDTGGGLLQDVTNTMALMYKEQPASTDKYLAYVSRKIAPTAYAQGYGYSSLGSIINIWSGFRNITYFFFVVFFVVLGFMIMFRTKINPQTVISIQNALPRVVVTLVLITFSYAIAGFFIDMIYFLTYIVVSVFNAAGVIDVAKVEPMLQKSIFRVFIEDIHGSRPNLNLTAEPGTDTIKQSFATALANIIEALTNGIIGRTGSIIASKFLTLGLTLTLLYALIRVFVTMLTAFINIVISVIFSPLFIIFNVFPGSNAFVNWLKSLLSNVLLFPAIAIVIMIAGALSGSTGFVSNPDTGYSSGSFSPPMFINVSDVDTTDIQTLIGFGMILILPSIANMLKEALKVEPLKVGKDLAAAATAATFIPRLLLGQAKKRSQALKEEQMLGRAFRSSG